MKNKIERPESLPPRNARWPAVLVVLLVAGVAFGLLLAQFSWADDPGNQLSLSNLDQRVPFLESITNWVQRDRACVPLSAMGRELDAALAPDARVFVTGMLGPTNMSKTGYYYFLKNYLFPRDVEISLDGKSVSTAKGFRGVPCDSADVLRSNGFDVMINFDNGPKLTPLTAKAFRRTNE